VKRSLLQKATGYSYHSEKIFCQDGAVTRVPVVEHVPPSDTTMIFYLKNRDPERWNDRRQVDVRASVRVAAIRLSTADLIKRRWSEGGFDNICAEGRPKLVLTGHAPRAVGKPSLRASPLCSMPLCLILIRQTHWLSPTGH